MERIQCNTFTTNTTRNVKSCKNVKKMNVTVKLLKEVLAETKKVSEV